MIWIRLLIFFLFFFTIYGLDDFYKTLGIPRTADKRTIKKAFSELSKKYHPDKNKNKEDGSHYTKIVNAYETLKDPQKKEEYDQKLLYGENDYSDVLFKRDRSQQRPYDEYGNFYSFQSSKSQFYRPHRKEEPINLGEIMSDFLNKQISVLYEQFFEIGPFLLENIYCGLSIMVLVALCFLNILLNDVHNFLKNK